MKPLAVDLFCGLGRGTGRMLDKRGYVLAMSKGHPRANRDGYVWEHIRVVERALGKYLPSTAIVHHMDGNPSNNAPKNLVVCPDQAYHKLLHQRAVAFAACGDASALKCDLCHSFERQEEMREYSYRRGKGHYGRHLSCNRKYVKGYADRRRASDE